MIRSTHTAFFLCLLSPSAVFSQEFACQRAQIIFHGHIPHLEFGGCQYQTLAACVHTPAVNKTFSLSSMFAEFYIQSSDSFFFFLSSNVLQSKMQYNYIWLKAMVHKVHNLQKNNCDQVCTKPLTKYKET